jgi:hypothetical protein
VDISKREKPVKEKPTVDVIPQKPQDSEFECFGCSS